MTLEIEAHFMRVHQCLSNEQCRVVYHYEDQFIYLENVLQKNRFFKDNIAIERSQCVHFGSPERGLSVHFCLCVHSGSPVAICAALYQWLSYYPATTPEEFIIISKCVNHHPLSVFRHLRQRR